MEKGALIILLVLGLLITLYPVFYFIKIFIGVSINLFRNKKNKNGLL